jgi:hypothetical protein
MATLLEKTFECAIRGGNVLNFLKGGRNVNSKVLPGADVQVKIIL